MVLCAKPILTFSAVSAAIVMEPRGEGRLDVEVESHCEEDEDAGDE